MAEGPVSPLITSSGIGSPQTPGMSKKRKPSYLTVSAKRRKTWSPRSTDHLMNLVNNKNSPINWKSICQLLTRSAKSCQAAYQRKSSPSSAICNTVDSTTQTDISVSPKGSIHFRGGSGTDLRTILVV